MQDLFLRGLLLALTAVSIPGPGTMYLLTVALRAGWRRALWVAISPLTSDLPVIIAVLFLLQQLQTLIPSLIHVIQIIGGLVLLWIAWGTWQQIQSGALFKASTDETDVALEPRAILIRATLINLTSPGPYLFWTTVNGPLLLGGLQQSVWHGLAFLVGFYGTFFLGWATLGFVFAAAGQVNPRLTRVAMIGALGLIVLFALQFIASGLGLIA